MHRAKPQLEGFSLKMLPHDWWGSCHEVTEGGAKQKLCVVLLSINAMLCIAPPYDSLAILALACTPNILLVVSLATARQLPHYRGAASSSDCSKWRP